MGPEHLKEHLSEGDESSLGQVALELLVGHQSGGVQQTKSGWEMQIWKPLSTDSDQARGV